MIYEIEINDDEHYYNDEQGGFSFSSRQFDQSCIKRIKNVRSLLFVNISVTRTESEYVIR